MIVNAEALRLPLADSSVDACLTSPPYWGGLRVYAGEQARDWPAISYAPMPGLPPVEIPDQAVALGHEPDPFAFVGHLLMIFREIRRVLKPAGCLAVNLGDCYNSTPNNRNGSGASTLTKPTTRGLFGSQKGARVRDFTNLRHKNLLLMPWRFALAMQADGWILRSRMPGGAEVLPETDVGIEPDIVWRKPTCMPESVRDRPTVDFEDVLIFSQSPRYFWDQEAGRERYATTPESGAHSGGFHGQAAMKPRGGGEDVAARLYGAAGRNMRSVWAINTEPTDEEHFAAWPVALASRLIRVMTSERGVCPDCGAPWVRQVKRQRCLDGVPVDGLGAWDTGNGAPTMGAQGVGHWRFFTRSEDLGWLAGCGCGVDPVPALVLDPFAGLGRTWEAAVATGRRFVGADLGLEYCRLARSRNDLGAMSRRGGRAKTITGPLFELQA